MNDTFQLYGQCDEKKIQQVDGQFSAILIGSGIDDCVLLREWSNKAGHSMVSFWMPSIVVNKS